MSNTVQNMGNPASDCDRFSNSQDNVWRIEGDVESLRYVLELEPIGEETDKSYKGIVRQVLRSGTKVSLLVRC